MIITLLTFCLTSKLSSQENLVQNGSFEEYEKCRKTKTYSDRTYLCKHWYLPWGTPDFYSDCARGQVYSKSNMMGIEEPRSGRAYAGTIAGGCNISCGSELLENELSINLEKDSLYFISFYVSLAEGSRCQLNYLEVSFFEKRIKSKKILIEHSADLVLNDTQSLSTTNGWSRLSGTYKARGGENLLVIGNFHNMDSTTHCIGVENDDFSSRYAHFDGTAYYYIDDVSLIKLSRPISFRNDMRSIRESAGTVVPLLDTDKDSLSIILKDIEFETDQSTLTKRSLPYLDSLAIQLIDKPYLCFDLVGHTDSIGSETSNQRLSENRATSVMQYISSKGVLIERMKASGKGETQPITTNRTAEGRAMNRRVEMKILK